METRLALTHAVTVIRLLLGTRLILTIRVPDLHLKGSIRSRRVFAVIRMVLNLRMTPRVNVAIAIRIRTALSLRIKNAINATRPLIIGRFRSLTTRSAASSYRVDIRLSHVLGVTRTGTINRSIQHARIVITIFMRGSLTVRARLVIRQKGGRRSLILTTRRRRITSLRVGM